MSFNTLPKIVEQLESCEYQTKDGLHLLTHNEAFIQLKMMAVLEAASKLETINFQNKIFQLHPLKHTDLREGTAFKLESSNHIYEYRSFNERTNEVLCKRIDNKDPFTWRISNASNKIFYVLARKA